MYVQTSGLALPRAASTRSERSEILHSTPIKLIVVGVLVAATLITTAVVTTFAVADRQNTLAALLSRTEPLSDAAQNLYGQLSVADAAAATAFLSGGLEPAAVRDRYSEAITSAAGEVVRASTGLDAGDSASQTTLAKISSSLPVYAGIIETARTNNRVGNPVGAAYLAEASTLMQTSILPWAEDLHNTKSDDVRAAQEQFDRPPWLSLVLVVVSIAVLVAAQRFVSRRTRRTLNPGLALGSIAMVVLFVWMLVVGLVSSSSTNRALVRGAEPVDRLTSGRILAQQARTDETIGMARRGGVNDYEQSYTAAIQSLNGVLFALQQDSSLDNTRIDASLDLVDQWTKSHERMNASLAVGDFATAVAIATGTNEGNSADIFAALDDELAQEIDLSREELRSNIARAASVLDGLTVGISVLAGGSLLAVAGGLGVRLREYL
ncbi:hypothetical protein ACNHUS_33280 [Actinomycetes bacterium M1A6_2h]